MFIKGKESRFFKFKENAIKIHGDLYNYDSVEYINGSTKVKILCNNCKNFFFQKPAIHLGKSGCQSCCKNKSYIKKAEKKKNYFFNFSDIIHNYQYDYSRVNYINTRIKVEIICKRCNRAFMQTPSGHMHGKGCKYCNNTYTIDKFLEKANRVHGNLYDYSKVIYKHSNTPVIIKCNSCNKEFLQKPVNHLFGRGCFECNSNNYSRSSFERYCNRYNKSTATLYVIKIFNNDESFLKIGITSKSVKQRFKKSSELPYKYETLLEFKDSLRVVWNLEKKLHKQNKEYKYIPKLEFDGMYECFDMRISSSLNINSILN